MNIVVVTAGDMLIVSRRSERVRMAPGVWNSSVSEGMSRDRWAPLAPALFHLALVHVHSRTPVERAAAQILRRMPRI